jgi:hypothetical protein
MAIYRHGVGRVWATRRGSHPFDVPSGSAPPHPGYDGATGLAKVCEVVERVELPGGMVAESYGLYPRSGRSHALPIVTPEPEPETAPVVLPKPAKDWRDNFGLARGG